VLPAELAYPGLAAALGEEVEARWKELEVYAGDEPPTGYSLDTEVDGILRFADEAGFERFHLLGYSGGGAASLAFTAKHPDRLLSLALLEPAWAGREDLRDAEEAVWRRFDSFMGLADAELMPAFTAAQLRPGVEAPAPPPGPPPPWMAKRPAGIRSLLDTFQSYELNLDALRAFARPVYFALGGLSNPDYFERMADRLAEVFPDFTLEVFDERHHFDPPHRVEPERLARSLRGQWARA
jgi:pimeloyl-ACP methyl ester carboxylesterase